MTRGRDASVTVTLQRSVFRVTNAPLANSYSVYILVGKKALRFDMHPAVLNTESVFLLHLPIYFVLFVRCTEIMQNFDKQFWNLEV